MPGYVLYNYVGLFTTIQDLWLAFFMLFVHWQFFFLIFLGTVCSKPYEIQTWSLIRMFLGFSEDPSIHVHVKSYRVNQILSSFLVVLPWKFLSYNCTKKTQLGSIHHRGIGQLQRETSIIANQNDIIKGQSQLKIWTLLSFDTFLYKSGK